MDYEDEIKDKYYLLKTEILNTAKNMIELESNNDAEFESKLKAICSKKKSLFEIECEGINEARIYNGKMKNSIREFDKMKESVLNNILKDIETTLKTLDK